MDSESASELEFDSEVEDREGGAVFNNEVRFYVTTLILSLVYISFMYTPGLCVWYLPYLQLQ